MRKNYIGFWLILACAFVIFAVISALDSFKIGDWEPKSSEIVPTLTGANKQQTRQAVTGAAKRAAQTKPKQGIPAPLDTASKTILFLGDSMLEGLSPRLAHYAHANGHKLYSVIWYSSTTEIWAQSGKITKYINEIHPDYIFISLGGNELFVTDIIKKRDKFVKQILKEIGDIPFVWIGPPNWKPDTGINDMIASNVPQGEFFLSDGMHFDRSRDGAHPTRESAILWMDSIARWMPLHAAHPIKMTKPAAREGRPEHVYVHQPDER